MKKEFLKKKKSKDRDKKRDEDGHRWKSAPRSSFHDADRWNPPPRDRFLPMDHRKDRFEFQRQGYVRERDLRPDKRMKEDWRYRSRDVGQIPLSARPMYNPTYHGSPMGYGPPPGGYPPNDHPYPPRDWRGPPDRDYRREYDRRQ